MTTSPKGEAVLNWFKHLILDWRKPHQPIQSDNVIDLPVPHPTPKEVTEDIARAFILDDHQGMGELVTGALSQSHRDPFTLDPRQAYMVLAQELMRRGMTALVLDIETFLQEWQEGIERTTVWHQADGTGGMIVRGCTIHPFTEVVEYLVKTARWDPPTATRLLDYESRSFTVFVAYGEVVSVF